MARADTETRQRRAGHPPRRFVACYGGAFDPPHLAHVFALTYLLTRDDVEAVWLVPAADHVFGKDMAPFAERVAMLEAIIARLGTARVRVCEIEAGRDGPSRTYETLEALEAAHPDHAFCWVIGADNLTESHRWHRFGDLVARWPLIVLGRPGHEAALAAAAPSPWCLPGPTLPDVSSTALRAALAGEGDRETLRWLPEVIAARARRLYGAPMDAGAARPPTLWILGAGSAGRALADGLRAGGAQVRLWNRSPAPGLDRAGPLPVDLDHCDVALLCVSDPAIGALADQIARAPRRPPVALHCAGRFGAEVLAPLAAKGVETGSLHPLQSLRGGAGPLRGAWCAVEGSPAAVACAERLVTTFGGRPVQLPRGEKAAYHAAAVLSANFLVTLGAGGVALLEALGIEAETARAMLAPLLRGTLDHFTQRAPRDALTGPLARRDVDAIGAHLAAIARHAPDFLPVYAALTRATAIWLPWTEAERAALEETLSRGPAPRR